MNNKNKHKLEEKVKKTQPLFNLSKLFIISDEEEPYMPSYIQFL